MHLCGYLEDQQRDIRFETTAIELVWMELLRKLNQRQPRIFRGVVSVPLAG